MLTAYLFCLFLVVYGYLFIPDRSRRQVADVEPKGTDNDNTLPADDRAGEGVANPDTLPDVATMTTRQLHRLCRDLRQSQGIQIQGYKALKLSQLREEIATAIH